MIIASDDQRFVKLARFLLDSRGIGVTEHVQPRDLGASLDEERVDAVLLDAGDALADTLRLSLAVQARRPNLPVVMVGDGASARAPEGAVIYQKWEQMDEAIDALVAGFDTRSAGVS